MDIEQTRRYVVAIVLIAVVIMLRDTFWTLIVTLFGVFGIASPGAIPPSFVFMIFAVIFFGFALFVVMILQKKKLSRGQRPKDIIGRGFCDICCNPRAKNVLEMDYKEKDKEDKIIYVCEKCRNEVTEIRENDKGT